MNDFAQVADVKSINNEVEITHKIGRMLVNSGKITKEDFMAIIAVQNQQDLRFGEAALSLGLLKEKDIDAVLAEQFSYTTVPDQASSLDAKLVAVFQPQSDQTEALRSLRSELLLRYFNKGSNLSLTLVGAENATGIALTAANLAIVFAQMGIRTLLVDANLRTPQLHRLFGMSDRNPGFSDLIAGRASVEPLAVPTIRSLWLLQAGTEAPNPQELLASTHCTRWLKELSAHFDVTIISTPPMKRSHDAPLVAVNSGAALLVVQENLSRLKDIEAICSNLRGLGVRVLGAALHQ